MQAPWKNAEGYVDPTAYKALKAIEQEKIDRQRRVTILIQRLKFAIDAEGFDLLNRIELKDRKTGREYK